MKEGASMKKIRVRYAPSPTGFLHIGNARSALFNYLFAKHHNGDFIIRIEDTDIARNVKDGEKSQFDNLAWLGVTWDESPNNPAEFGPYRQLERLELYQKYAQDLLEKGFAYKDYKDNSDQYAIRFKIPSDTTYTFDDMVRGTLNFESKEIEDWIILKENGIPTYNFAVVIDDHLMEITHVLRGEEHITNTPKQLMVYQAFNWETPIFGHMAIIVNENKKKLSKRDTNVIQFIHDYAKLGYLPDAMFNFISLLGWSPNSNQEILSKEELIQLFDEKRLSKAPAMFDKDKLAYINKFYLKQLSLEALIKLCKPFLLAAKIEIKDDLWLEQLLTIFQDRLVYGAMIVDLYHEFFHENFELSTDLETTLLSLPTKEVLNQFVKEIQNLEFSATNLEEALKEVGLITQKKGKDLFMPIRIATTAEAHGPSLPVSLSLLGKEKVLARINITLENLGANE